MDDTAVLRNGWMHWPLPPHSSALRLSAPGGGLRNCVSAETRQAVSSAISGISFFLSVSVVIS